MFMRTKIW